MICDLISLAVLLVVLGVVYYLVSMIPMKEPFPRILFVVAILIAVLMVVGTMFGGVDVPKLRWVC